MISIDKVQEILDDLAEELPKEFYKELNGGILLLPEEKKSPYAVGNDLYILGEYRVSPSMGRLISIYYGSFIRLFGHLGEDQLTHQLRHTLRHEFTHHLESLSGEKGLEIKDEEYINKYLNSHKKEENS